MSRSVYNSACVTAALSENSSETQRLPRLKFGSIQHGVFLNLEECSKKSFCRLLVTGAAIALTVHPSKPPEP